MNTLNRLCRICLMPEDTVTFQRILDCTKRFALDLFYVTQIKIIEIDKTVPALICPRCTIDLTSASRFKKISLVADSYFHKLLQPHEDQFLNQDNNETKEPEKIEEIQQDEEVKDEEVEIEVLDEYLDDIIEYDEFEEVPEALKDDNTTEEYFLIPIESEIPQEKPKTPIDVKRRIVTGNKNIHECFCGAKFVSPHRLSNHIKVRHTEIPDEDKLTCLTCGKKFKIQEYLELHIRNQHTDNPMKHRQKVPCSICGKVLKSIVALKNHEDKHIADSLPESETKKFSCDLCGMRFRLKCYVFNHMNNVHLRNKYPCEFCGKGFYKKYEKMEHVVRMHTNERPILCEYEGCGKTFARQKNYNIHKRIHTNERPFSCEYCEKTFIHFIDKKRHVMTHTGERPYPCKSCPKAFMRRAELEVHSRSHFGY
ncbi:unnamed protein product [Chironomus riparius]|uniref:Uncharacterized protein n=1 Tax=Chironomus riparius TaxID=315576 RepID=A0A9N9SCC8_9DIPT|nr:unnamed protein product [Chironomus riparius]